MYMFIMEIRKITVIIDIVLGLVGALLNILALIALRLGINDLQPKHRFLITLNISDILMALSIVVIRILELGRTYNLIGFTYTFYFIGVASLTSSLVCIGCDLFVAICKALRYESLMTKRRITIAILVQWSWSIAIGVSYISCRVLDMANTNKGFFEADGGMCLHFSTVYLGHLGLCALAIIIFYGRVLWEVWHMKRMVQPSQGQSLQDNTKSAMKAITTILLIIGTLGIFLLPAYIVTFFGPEFEMIKRISVNWSMLNSIADPLIYSIRMSELRAGYKKMFSLCKRDWRVWDPLYMLTMH